MEEHSQINKRAPFDLDTQRDLLLVLFFLELRHIHQEVGGEEVMNTYNSSYNFSEDVAARLDNENYIDWYRGYAAGVIEYMIERKQDV